MTCRTAGHFLNALNCGVTESGYKVCRHGGSRHEHDDISEWPDNDATLSSSECHLMAEPQPRVKRLLSLSVSHYFDADHQTLLPNFQHMRVTPECTKFLCTNLRTCGDVVENS